MRCEALTEQLSASSGTTELLDPAARAHVEGCLRCQAEVVRYRKLLKALRALRTDVLAPAPGLVADVLATLEQAGERQALRAGLRGRRVAYAGGIAVAAGGAALVVASRVRRVKLAG